VTGTFEAWLAGEMAARGIRSARRLALDAGLDPDRVTDWLVSAAMPSDAECATLAAYLGVDAAEVRERRFPDRRRTGDR
jgi:hypothetical protein